MKLSYGTSRFQSTSTVKKLSKVRLCPCMQRNASGRDFVVGDLHGHRAMLESELARLGFDPRADRLFSVGDLINRGPDSLGTLALLEEPWFHAVMGNHELMLLNWLGYYNSRVHSRKAFEFGSGRWIVEAAARHRKLLRRLADRVAALPISIHVDGPVPFNVMHGDLGPLGLRQVELLSKLRVCVHEADRTTTSRANLGDASGACLSEMPFGAHRVRVTARPVGVLELTYVGHSPIRHITVHNSYVYIDRGAGAVSPRSGSKVPLTVLEHAAFSNWLTGATAPPAGPAAPSDGAMPDGPMPVPPGCRPARSRSADRRPASERPVHV